jgi:hypothetical protein
MGVGMNRRIVVVIVVVGEGAVVAMHQPFEPDPSAVRIFTARVG